MSATDRPSPLPLTREFPFKCPHCSQHAGFPIGMVTANNDPGVVVARCRRCEHTWHLQRPAGGPIGRRW